MNAGALLAAYHGCDAVTRDDLVSGRLKNLQASENKYDWLGSGAYFFENDAARAFPKDQDVLLRALDSAVFNFIHKARELENAPAFQAVRGAFLQGEEVAPSSGFYARPDCLARQQLRTGMVSASRCHPDDYRSI